MFYRRSFSDDRAFLLLNNSNKVQVVNRYNFKKTGEITAQLDNPRYMTISNEIFMFPTISITEQNM
jgi:hypothetical protein